MGSNNDPGITDNVSSMFTEPFGIFPGGTDANNDPNDQDKK